MRHDVTFPLYVEVDEIYNLACPASPVHYQFDPVADDKDERHRRDQHAGSRPSGSGRKVLQASTSEVYGDPSVPSADRGLPGEREPAGTAGLLRRGQALRAETLFFDYFRQHKVRIKVARIFNTYGPRMHPEDGRVVSTSSCRRLRGDDITLYGDGSQTRAFCYVDDLVWTD